jgi:hypothetical protein
MLKHSCALVVLATLLSGCEAGPGSVHSVGVSQGCADLSPFLSGANGVPVRCGPQYQPITGE